MPRSKALIAEAPEEALSWPLLLSMASKATVWPEETVNLGAMFRDHFTWPQSRPTWKLFQPGGAMLVVVVVLVRVSVVLIGTNGSSNLDRCQNDEAISDRRRGETDGWAYLKRWEKEVGNRGPDPGTTRRELRSSSRLTVREGG